MEDSGSLSICRCTGGVFDQVVLFGSCRSEPQAGKLKQDLDNDDVRLSLGSTGRTSMTTRAKSTTVLKPARQQNSLPLLAFPGR